jgi:hypothetical protein
VRLGRVRVRGASQRLRKLCDMADQGEFYGPAFGAAVAAGALKQGTIVVLDGHVLETASDPDDPGRVRLVIVPALGPLRDTIRTSGTSSSAVG